jgi:hypothetical protein
MTALHAPHGPDNPAHPASPAGPDTVNRSLTPERTRRLVENDDYAAFARRILRPTPAVSLTATSKPSSP